MGYSRNRSTLIQRLDLLGELSEGRNCHWELNPETDPQSFAYQIREALYIAALYKSEFPRLAEAAGRFTIEVVGPTLVQARLKKGPTEAKVLAGEARPMSGLETEGKHELSGMSSVEAIIEHVIRSHPTNDRFVFDHAQLSVPDLVRLWRWAQLQKPKWLMFVTSEGIVTISRWRRDLAELAWLPIDAGVELAEEETAEEEDSESPVLSRTQKKKPEEKPQYVEPGDEL